MAFIENNFQSNSDFKCGNRIFMVVFPPIYIREIECKNLIFVDSFASYVVMWYYLVPILYNFIRKYSIFNWNTLILERTNHWRNYGHGHFYTNT